MRIKLTAVECHNGRRMNYFDYGGEEIVVVTKQDEVAGFHWYVAHPKESISDEAYQQLAEYYSSPTTTKAPSDGMVK